MNSRVMAWMVGIMLDSTIEWKTKKLGKYERRVSHGI